MFDPNTIYKVGDPALAQIAPASTMAHWRVQKVGPPYIRLGLRIGYRGSDLNAWLESRKVQTH